MKCRIDVSPETKERLKEIRKHIGSPSMPLSHVAQTCITLISWNIKSHDFDRVFSEQKHEMIWDEDEEI